MSISGISSNSNINQNQLSQIFQSMSNSHKPSAQSSTQPFLNQLQSIGGTLTSQTESSMDSSQSNSTTNLSETSPDSLTQLTQLFQSVSDSYTPCDPSSTLQLIAALESGGAMPSDQT